MYLNILKKDLKRKKTMNLILFLFVILASMFVASSVNNIIAVTTGLNSYFEKAGMTDYFAATIDKAGSTPIANTLDEIDGIESYGIEHILYGSPENFTCNGEKMGESKNTSMLMAFEDAEINYFNEENEIITEVKPGTVIISGKCIRDNNLQIGDKLEIKFGDISQTVEIAGSFKDAIFGSEMMGISRFIISEQDYKKFVSDKTIATSYGGSVCYITTNDIPAVQKALSEQGNSLIFLGDQNFIKMSYVMNILIAGILLVVSVCLILIAFVILQFTISFTLTEEFREIGVMKAIGIQDMKIRGLYMVKYFALAVVGSSIGLVLSIPFGNMLMASVSQSIILETDNRSFINIICSAIVVVVILCFCMLCTKKIKKFTPIDAIRSGSTGERFQKKGILRLSHTPFTPSGFLALNDVLSHPRRFGIVILTFTLCLSLVLILVNTANTLQSDQLITSFGMIECDVCYADEGSMMSYMVENGRELLTEDLAQIEQTLSENGMPARCASEMMMSLTLVHGESVCRAPIIQGTGTTTAQYAYFEGTPPQSADEIAITKTTADKLNVSIGDTITIRQLDGSKNYIISALFQSMLNMGDGVRLHETADANFLQASGFLSFQITFTDNPDKREILNRIEKIKVLYDTEKIYTAGEYVDTISGVSGMLENLTMLILSVVSVIIILITVLMERSFIAKERGEIAILKAIGFRNGTLIKWHTLRFVIATTLAVILTLIFLAPMTRLVNDPIFKMMGADFGVRYEIVPLEVYVIYPLYVLIITLVSAFLAAQNIRTIDASESSNVE